MFLLLGILFKVMKILIDAYNIGLQKGTGVATYGRGLCEIVELLSGEVYLLYDKQGVSRKNPTLSAATFYESKLKNKKKSMVLNALAFSGSVCNRRVKLLNMNEVVVQAGASSLVPSNVGIYNKSDIFLFAKIYFQLTGKFLELKLEEKVDIAHWTFPLPIRISGAKNIYTVHDVIPLKIPYATLDDKKYYWSLMHEIVTTADKLITVSETSKNDIIEIFGVNEDFVVNTFQHVNIVRADVREFTDFELSELFGLKKREYFVFCGAIEPKKNLSRLLEAFLTINTNTKLVIIGPDGWETSYEPLVQQYLTKTKTFIGDERILRLGYVSRQMLLSLISSSKGFLFPSIYEGFGLPVLEAMSLGVPVLTSNNGALKEVVADAAITVDPFSVESIRDGIVKLDNDSVLAEVLRKSGYERSKVFSLNNHLTKLQSMYHSII